MSLLNPFTSSKRTTGSDEINPTGQSRGYLNNIFVKTILFLIIFAILPFTVIGFFYSFYMVFKRKREPPAGIIVAGLLLLAITIPAYYFVNQQFYLTPFYGWKTFFFEGFHWEPLIFDVILKPFFIQLSSGIFLCGLFSFTYLRNILPIEEEKMRKNFQIPWYRRLYLTKILIPKMANSDCFSPDLTVLGYDMKTGHPVFLEKNSRKETIVGSDKQHMLIFGGTNTGKTGTLATLAKSWARKGEGMLIIDMKSSPVFAENLYQYAKLYNRPFYQITEENIYSDSGSGGILQIPKVSCIDIFQDCEDSQQKTLIIQSLDGKFDSVSKSEQYFDTITGQYILSAFEAMDLMGEKDQLLKFRDLCSNANKLSKYIEPIRYCISDETGGSVLYDAEEGYSQEDIDKYTQAGEQYLKIAKQKRHNGEKEEAKKYAHIGKKYQNIARKLNLINSVKSIIEDTKNITDLNKSLINTLGNLNTLLNSPAGAALRPTKDPNRRMSFNKMAEEGAITVISVGMGHGRAGNMLANLFIRLALNFTGDRINKKFNSTNPYHVIVEEFNSVKGSSVDDLANKAREGNIRLLLSTQSVSDIISNSDRGEETFKKILANTGTVIIHRIQSTEEAERIALISERKETHVDVFGTKFKDESNNTGLDRAARTGETSLKKEMHHVLTMEDVKNLKIGELFLIRIGDTCEEKTQKVKVILPNFVKQNMDNANTYRNNHEEFYPQIGDDYSDNEEYPNPILKIDTPQQEEWGDSLDEKISQLEQLENLDFDNTLPTLEKTPPPPQNIKTTGIHPPTPKTSRKIKPPPKQASTIKVFQKNLSKELEEFNLAQNAIEDDGTTNVEKFNSIW